MAAVATAAVGILLGIHGFGQLFYSPVLGIGMLGVGCLLLALGAVFTVSVSYTHLRAHETRHDLVCRLLLEKKKKKKKKSSKRVQIFSKTNNYLI